MNSHRYHNLRDYFPNLRGEIKGYAEQGVREILNVYLFPKWFLFNQKAQISTTKNDHL